MPGRRTTYHSNEHRRTALRQRAWAVYDHACWRCGTDLEHERWDLDHIHRLADGGDDFDLDNVRPACIPCNRGRGKRTTLITPTTTSRDW